MNYISAINNPGRTLLLARYNIQIVALVLRRIVISSKTNPQDESFLLPGLEFARLVFQGDSQGCILVGLEVVSL